MYLKIIYQLYSLSLKLSMQCQHLILLYHYPKYAIMIGPTHVT